MYISINENNEIKEVGVTTDPNLKSIYVDETSPMFPFRGWSDAKVCCYKVSVNERGIITMLTPYVDSRLIEHFDQIGMSTQDNSDGLFDMADATSDISDALFELADYVAELEEW